MNRKAIPLADIRTDGGTQPRAAIDPEVVAEYAEAMGRNVDFPPVTVFFDGSRYWLADGFHRLEAAAAAGADDIDADIRQGTLRDAVLFSLGANAGHGLRRTNEDKRRAVMRALSDPEWKKWSDRAIAEKCSVSDRFVNAMRAESSANGSQIKERIVTRNGTTYTQNTANIGKARAPDPVVNEMPLDDDEDEGYVSVQDEARERMERPSTGSFHVSTGEVEWYTPAHIIARVSRAFRGPIGLDPASSKEAQKTVRALRYHTLDDDGLAHEWSGDIFLNPPFAMPAIKHFADKAVRTIEEGSCGNIVVLVNNATDTDWFQALLRAASCVCFVDGRIGFYNNLGETLQARQGQALFYWGASKADFCDAFADMGTMMERLCR